MKVGTTLFYLWLLYSGLFFGAAIQYFIDHMYKNKTWFMAIMGVVLFVICFIGFLKCL